MNKSPKTALSPTFQPPYLPIPCRVNTKPPSPIGTSRSSHLSPETNIKSQNQLIYRNLKEYRCKPQNSPVWLVQGAAIFIYIAAPCTTEIHTENQHLTLLVKPRVQPRFLHRLLILCFSCNPVIPKNKKSPKHFPFSVKIPIFASVPRAERSNAAKPAQLPNRYRLPNFLLFKSYLPTDYKKTIVFLGKEFSYETFSSKEIELEKSESDGSKRTVTVTKIALNGKKRRKSNKKLKDNLADDESRCLAELNEKHMEFVFFSADTNQNKENKEKAREYVMQLLNSAENECLICDPYFKKEDFEKYIFFMEKLDVKVRIINSEKQLGNISAPDSEDYLLKLNDCINYYNRKVGREVAECRSLTKNLSIHDRFIIIDDCGWLIGSSLNEFGNRASSICKIPQGSLEYMRKNFERWWNDTENSESLDGYIQRKVKLNASPEGKLLKHITHLTRVLNSLKSQLAK